MSAMGQTALMEPDEVQLGATESVYCPQTPPAHLAQAGVDLYNDGKYLLAIACWQDALSAYQGRANTMAALVIYENLARAFQQVDQLDQAIKHWQLAIDGYRQIGDIKHVGWMLTEQAQVYGRLGHSRKAIALLCGSSTESFDSELAIDRTCVSGSAYKIAVDLGDRKGKLAALGTLGNAYRLRGEYTIAIQLLEQGISVIDALPDHEVSLHGQLQYRASMENSLGNAYASRFQRNWIRALATEQRIIAEDSEQSEEGRFRVINPLSEVNKCEQLFLTPKIMAECDYNNALQYFSKALEITYSQEIWIQTLLNIATLYDQIQETSLEDYKKSAEDALTATVSQATALFDEELIKSQAIAYSAIKLARLLLKQPMAAPANSDECINRGPIQRAMQLLDRAREFAQDSRVQNFRVLSFALGEIGHIYETCRDYNHAIDYTDLARQTARDPEDRDSLYQWEWQIGRIYREQQEVDSETTIKAYTGAITIAEEIRNDILSADRDIQFDVRDSVGLLYREFIDLNLANLSDSWHEIDADQQRIKSILETINSLQLSELQDYFGNDCLVEIQDLNLLDSDNFILNNSASQQSRSALIISIILPQYTGILAVFPDGSQKFSAIPLPFNEFRDKVNRFRSGLEDYRDTENYDVQVAEELYDWLVRPFLQELKRNEVDTIVFLQDGILRSGPMAALYDGREDDGDGRKFLIEDDNT